MVCCAELGLNNTEPADHPQRQRKVLREKPGFHTVEGTDLTVRLRKGISEKNADAAKIS